MKFNDGIQPVTIVVEHSSEKTGFSMCDSKMNQVRRVGLKVSNEIRSENLEN